MPKTNAVPILFIASCLLVWTSGTIAYSPHWRLKVKICNALEAQTHVLPRVHALLAQWIENWGENLKDSTHDRKKRQVIVELHNCRRTKTNYHASKELLSSSGQSGQKDKSSQIVR